jgi:hypothetical protein
MISENYFKAKQELADKCKSMAESNLKELVEFYENEFDNLGVRMIKNVSEYYSQFRTLAENILDEERIAKYPKKLNYDPTQK